MGKQVNNKEEKASTRSGMVGFIVDGTHEAYAALMLRDRRVTSARGASRFRSLQTRLKRDRVIPVGFAVEPEPVPFVDFDLQFFPVDDVGRVSP